MKTDNIHRKLKAAAYIRMSTEHQIYSPVNQMEAIKEYAAKNDFEIIKTYSDEGKSGLRVEGRVGLQQMIADVQEGKAEYEAILVLDCTRWGRFQDADEAGYYEYACKLGGAKVHYVAEPFTNDGSFLSNIGKLVKRGGKPENIVANCPARFMRGKSALSLKDTSKAGRRDTGCAEC